MELDIRDYYDGLNLTCLLSRCCSLMNMDHCGDLSAYAGAGPAVANDPNFQVPSDLKMSMDLTLYLRGGARLTITILRVMLLTQSTLLT